MIGGTGGQQLHLARLPNFDRSVVARVLVAGLEHRQQTLGKVLVLAAVAQRPFGLAVEAREARGAHRVVTRNTHHRLPDNTRHGASYRHLAQRGGADLQANKQPGARQRHQYLGVVTVAQQGYFQRPVIVSGRNAEHKNAVRIGAGAKAIARYPDLSVGYRLASFGIDDAAAQLDGALSHGWAR